FLSSTKWHSSTGFLPPIPPGNRNSFRLSPKIMQLHAIIESGGVGERLKPAVLKTVRLGRVSGGRIPPPPPLFTTAAESTMSPIFPIATWQKKTTLSALRL